MYSPLLKDRRQSEGLNIWVTVEVCCGQRVVCALTWEANMWVSCPVYLSGRRGRVRGAYRLTCRLPGRRRALSRYATPGQPQVNPHYWGHHVMSIFYYIVRI